MVRFLGDSGPFDQHNIAWRGQVRFTPNTTTGHAIDYVPMEQYLRGVVPRESPSSWPVEALRAQAVAARSYAFDAASSGSVLWCDTHSQVYNGADDGTSSHESAKTDAAVSATANEYVVYGTRIIKTFFSSSSGGRTANIEDVWLTSAPQPYYTSVDDADDLSSNPNYRWTLADMSGTTLAGKIRAYSAALAHPSPATVTSVRVDPGTSGFVRHVTLSWSKGAATVLTGTQFQSALRLKTSAFTVTLKNPPAPPVPRFQETDRRPLWIGAWATAKSASASGGGYRRADVAGPTMTVMFKGTSFSWIGTRSDHAGKADVVLDGTRIATVDLYDSSTHFRSVVWMKTGLSAATTHTVVIKALGTHRSASHGSSVYVDAVDVAGTLLAVPRPPVWKRHEQTSSAVAYSGSWSSSALAGLSGGTHTYSHDTSATAVFTFTGSRVRWIGKRAANYGKAWVSVDASAPVLVDLYSATTRNRQRLFESATLATGRHTMTIRVTGTKNPKASYHYVDVDAFDALEPAK
jgi:SpoIID/LytB domain protein